MAGRMNSMRVAKLGFTRALLTKKQITNGGGVGYQAIIREGAPSFNEIEQRRHSMEEV